MNWCNWSVVCTVTGTLYQGALYQGALCQASCARHTAPGALHQAHCTRHTAPRSLRQRHRARHTEPGTPSQVHCIRYTARGTLHSRGTELDSYQWFINCNGWLVWSKRMIGWFTPEFAAEPIFSLHKHLSNSNILFSFTFNWFTCNIFSSSSVRFPINIFSKYCSGIEAGIVWRHD